MIFQILFMGLQLWTLDPQINSRELSIDPSRNRNPISFNVHPRRGCMLVFSSAPDGQIINNDPENWFITHAKNGLPAHAFHFKPQSDQGGLVSNSFLFFKGYPVELSYASTLDLEAAQTIIYIEISDSSERIIETKGRRPEIQPLSKAPEQSREQMERDLQQPKPCVKGSSQERVKRLKIGSVHWSPAEKKVVFKPARHMADLSSIEVVRAKRKFLTRILVDEEPVPMAVENTGYEHHVAFRGVHLARGERYFLRLFFAGSKEPVFVKLKGIE